MASWRAPSSILEAPGLDFGASRPRFWSLQARLWSSWHNCLLCLAFSCSVLLSLAFSCCLLLSLTFSCLLLPALAFSCFLLLSLDSYGLPCAFRSIATQVSRKIVEKNARWLKMRQKIEKKRHKSATRAKKAPKTIET